MGSGERRGFGRVSDFSDFDTFGMDHQRHWRPRAACEPCDIDGKPVKRTKASHPYAYDLHVIWRGRAAKETGADYSDRLHQWDPEKFDRCAKEHMPGKRFNNATGGQVEAFLRAYHGDPGLHLIAIQEGCNPSNGYPYWTFHYQSAR